MPARIGLDLTYILDRTEVGPVGLSGRPTV